MKFNSIKSICKRSSTCVLFDDKHEKENGEEEYVQQWIGDGNAMYPLYDMALLDENSICALFDLTEKQKEKFNFRQTDLPREKYCFEDTDARPENYVESSSISISYLDLMLIPLFTPFGLLFIQANYMNPLQDDSKDLEY